MKLLLLAVAALTAHAEFLHIEVFMKDMNCPSCSDSLDKAFERVRGVKHVAVSMNDGTVTLELSDQNRVTLEQVWDTIKRIGFTPGETKVIVRGAVKGDSLTVLLIDKTIKIEGRAAEAENIELKGTIAPPPDPRTSLKLRITD
ncbi:MAG TPA: heavy-metal-associated domain-containing protein [Bryobacteraceae bacterium]|jgi:copper chaperone CopZ|nr:heavy-metal-associated domain-containing protein [Bryobacteraceae bacterium]